MNHHLFTYTLNEKPPQMKQFLCDCEMCLQFKFEECEKKNEERNEDADVEIETELCRLDEDHPDADTLDDSPAYNFIEVPAFVSMLSNDKNHELCYIVKLMKKGVANGDIVDEYGHTIKLGQKYFESRYMENIEEKKCFIHYKVLENKVLYIQTKRGSYSFC